MNPQTSPEADPGPSADATLLEAHWDRFVAWCAATDNTPLPVSSAAIDQFLTVLPAPSIVRVSTRFDALTLQEMYEELGNTDSAVDLALARLAAVLNDAPVLDMELGSAASRTSNR